LFQGVAVFPQASEKGALKSEIAAEVIAAGAFGVRYLGRGAFLKDLSVDQDVRAVADAEGLSYVVVSDKNPDPFLLQCGDDLLNVLNGEGIDAGKRLVE
jgi:hypothetical protein